MNTTNPVNILGGLLEQPPLRLHVLIDGYYPHGDAQVAIAREYIDGLADPKLGLATTSIRQERQGQQPEKARPRPHRSAFKV